MATVITSEVTIQIRSTAQIRGHEAKHLDNDPKCEKLGWLCVPLAVDVYGQWCEEAHQTFAQVALRLSVQTKVSFSSALSSIYNTLALVLVRQNACAILARRPARVPIGTREVLLLAPSRNRT